MSWVTVKVCPATVIVPVLEVMALSVIGATVKLTLPLPVPVKLLRVIHEVVVDAAHLQVVSQVSPKLPWPPVE